MNRVVYPVLMTKTGDEKDTYLVEIPDLNGFTEGFSLSDAIEMARDYIACACYEREPIPPSDALVIDPRKGEFSDVGKTFVTLVDVDMDYYKRKFDNRAVRKNVSIPAWLNREAEAAHVNISKVLQNALMEKLGVNG